MKSSTKDVSLFCEYAQFRFADQALCWFFLGESNSGKNSIIYGLISHRKPIILLLFNVLRQRRLLDISGTINSPVSTTGQVSSDKKYR